MQPWTLRQAGSAGKPPPSNATCLGVQSGQTQHTRSAHSAMAMLGCTAHQEGCVTQAAPLTSKRQHALTASLAALCGVYLLCSCSGTFQLDTASVSPSHGSPTFQDDLPDRWAGQQAGSGMCSSLPDMLGWLALSGRSSGGLRQAWQPLHGRFVQPCTACIATLAGPPWSRPLLGAGRHRAG